MSPLIYIKAGFIGPIHKLTYVVTYKNFYVVVLIEKRDECVSNSKGV